MFAKENQFFDFFYKVLQLLNSTLYDDINVVKHIKIQRLPWLGHVLRMDSSNPVRKVFESEQGGGCRRQGRPPQRWAKQVDENLNIHVIIYFS